MNYLSPICEVHPKAWLGYSCVPSHRGKAMIRVCAWCPDKRAAEQLAAKYGHEVTHSICEDHFAEQMGTLKLD